VTGPRNRKALERSQEVREEIRRMLLEHPPLAPPLTAKEVRTRLGARAPSLRAVQWHVQAIRVGAAG